MSLESNEAVFTVVAALNACGYDAGLEHASAIRLRVRREMAKKLRRPRMLRPHMTSYARLSTRMILAIPQRQSDSIFRSPW